MSFKNLTTPFRLPVGIDRDVIMWWIAPCSGSVQSRTNTYKYWMAAFLNLYTPLFTACGEESVEEEEDDAAIVCSVALLRIFSQRALLAFVYITGFISHNFSIFVGQFSSSTLVNNVATLLGLLMLTGFLRRRGTIIVTIIFATSTSTTERTCGISCCCGLLTRALQ